MKTRTIQVKWVTTAGYTDLADIGIGQGTWQIIPKDGGIYFRDDTLMSAGANPYTAAGIYVPRDATDVYVEFTSEAASVYLPAGTSVCLRKVELD
jgi:hypothetical protein